MERNDKVFSMEEDLISVIVSVYNVEEYLPRCLDSIANQTYRNLEIILVDDGSTDGSGRICDEYAAKDHRTRVIHQTNKGLWAARNAGQDAAEGKFLFFPDADDYFHKDTLTLLHVAITIDGKDLPLAICNVKMTTRYDEDIYSNQSLMYKYLCQDDLFAFLFADGPLELIGKPNWNKLYRVDSLPSPFQKNFIRAQDWDSNMRFYPMICEAIYVENTLYYYYQHSEQLTKAQDYWELRFDCEISMLHDNYMDLPLSCKQYSHYYLEKLYRRMIVWKAKREKFSNPTVILRQCKKYEKDTIAGLLKNKNISINRKIIYFFLLRFDRFTKVLLKITNNL